MADLIDTAVNSTGQLFNAISETTEQYLALEKIIPGVTEAMVEQSGDIRMLAKEIDGLSKSGAFLRQQMSQISAAFGISTEAQIDLLKTTVDYHQGLDKATSSTLQFIKASGAQSSEIGKMSAKLKIMSNISSSTFNEMYTSILKVREEYGLTGDQIDEISNIILKYATYIDTASSSIANASESISVMVSKLTGAGMEIGDVSDMFDKILDPDKMTDNIMLLSKMGYTLSDLTIGDPTEKLEQALPKLKQIGIEITSQQNRIIANEMAKVYGITLETARAFADIDLTKNGAYEKTLYNYTQEVTTLNDSLKNFANIVTGAGASMIQPFAGAVEELANLISSIPIIGPAAMAGIVTGAVTIVAPKIKRMAERISDFIGEHMGISFMRSVNGDMKSYISKVGERAKEKEKDIAEIKIKNGKMTADFDTSMLSRKERRQVERNKKAVGTDIDYFSPEKRILAAITDTMGKSFFANEKEKSRYEELKALSESHIATPIMREEYGKTTAQLNAFEQQRNDAVAGLFNMLKGVGGFKDYNSYKDIDSVLNSNIGKLVLDNVQLSKDQSEKLDKTIKDNNSNITNILKTIENILRSEGFGEASSNMIALKNIRDTIGKNDYSGDKTNEDINREIEKYTGQTFESQQKSGMTIQGILGITKKIAPIAGIGIAAVKGITKLSGNSDEAKRANEEWHKAVENFTGKISGWFSKTFAGAYSWIGDKLEKINNGVTNISDNYNEVSLREMTYAGKIGVTKEGDQMMILEEISRGLSRLNENVTNMSDSSITV